MTKDNAEQERWTGLLGSSILTAGLTIFFALQSYDHLLLRSGLWNGSVGLVSGILALIFAFFTVSFIVIWWLDEEESVTIAGVPFRR